MAGSQRQLEPLRLALVLAAWSWLMLSTDCASAHEGPPFPILMDKPAAGHVVSVWADPDIGEATFYVIVETPAGAMPDQEPKVALSVQPVSGRLERVEYAGKRQNLSGRMQFEFTPEFDQRDMWTVVVQLETAAGAAGQLTTEVESTPPGLGVWDFAIYLFPFVLLGAMWIAGMIRRRRFAPGQPSAQNDPPESKRQHCESVAAEPAGTSF